MEEKREKNRVSIIGSEIQNVLYAYVDIAKYNMYSWKDDSIDRTHVEKSNVETAERLDRDAKKCWDEFYKENETNFYKDRHYLHHVFEGIIQNDAKTPSILLEIGCGVGNAFFPLLDLDSNLFVSAIDLSSEAVEFVRKNKKYNEKRCDRRR